MVKKKIKKIAEVAFFGGCAVFGAFGLAKVLTPEKNYISADINPDVMSGLPENKSEED